MIIEGHSHALSGLVTGLAAGIVLHYGVPQSIALAGFTAAQVELIANVARYHRKSLPSIDHEPFAALPASDAASFGRPSVFGISTVGFAASGAALGFRTSPTPLPGPATVGG